MHQKTFKNNVPVFGVFWDPIGRGVLFQCLLLIHTLQRKLSKKPDITDYSHKVTEIWLIDKDLKEKEFKTFFFMTFGLLER